MCNCEVKMKATTPKLLDYGFEVADGWGNGKHTWYMIEVPQTFRGKYTVYLCDDDICGVFQGMSTQDHEFKSLMDKLSFRSPEAVTWMKDKLDKIKEAGAADFEIINWEV